MIKNCTLLVLICSIFLACETTDSSTPLTPDELVQGTWKVQEAIIDGTSNPITTPGLGQIELTVDGDNFTYVYPQTDEQGIPTGETETVSGMWSLNSDASVFTVTDPSGQVGIMEWTVTQLTVGNFSTLYEEQNPQSGTTSTFEFTYRLDN